jgi:tetratricopeptide (TPR) repeat protein
MSFTPRTNWSVSSIGRTLVPQPQTTRPGVVLLELLSAMAEANTSLTNSSTLSNSDTFNGDDVIHPPAHVPLELDRRWERNVTFLMVAAHEGLLHQCYVLVAAGASLSAVNMEGKTPRGFARAPRVAEWLGLAEGDREGALIAALRDRGFEREMDGATEEDARWFSRLPLVREAVRRRDLAKSLSDEGVAAGERHGDRARAVRLYRESLALDPYNGLTWYNLGNSLAFQKQYEEALAALANADPERPVVSSVKAACLLGLKRLPEALAELDKADRDSPVTLVLRAQILIAMKGVWSPDTRRPEDTEILGVLDRCIQLHPEHAPAYGLTAKILKEYRGTWGGRPAQARYDAALARYLALERTAY